jgi:type VI secretion system protein ImpG
MGLKSYYEHELKTLVEEGHRFSLHHPEIAASLNMNNTQITDPQVSRLLEGCAFLTAQIHQRLDEEDHDLPEQMIQQLWPQGGEAFPSCCLAKATPLPGLQQRKSLPEGTILLSEPLGEEQTRCQFVTVAPMDIYPLVLQEVLHEQAAGERLRFEFHSTHRLNDLSFHTLTLSLHTQASRAAALLQLIFSPQAEVKAFWGGKEMPAHGLRFTLPGLRLSLNPAGSGRRMPEQLLFEAFAFPEKLDWLVVEGLGSLAFSDEAHAFALELTLPRALPHDYRFTAEDFSLFTLPCINQFEHDCEPIRLDHRSYHYPLIPDHQKPESLHALSLIRVSGVAEFHQDPVTFESLHEAQSLSQPYVVVHQGGGPLRLSFHTQDLQEQTLSVQARVTNAHFSRRHLKAGGLHLGDKQLQGQISMSNLQTPSRFLEADTAQQSLQLLRLLRVQADRLQSVEDLKALLRGLNRGENTSLSNNIESMVDLSLRSGSLLKKGVFYTLRAIRLEVNEKGFSSSYDAFVFGMILHAFFQASAPLSVTIQTIMVLQPSEEVFEWSSL